jgi:hypothetical protein
VLFSRREPQIRNKFKIQISNVQNVIDSGDWEFTIPTRQSCDYTIPLFRILCFGHLNLFGASDFEFRIFPFLDPGNTSWPTSLRIRECLPSLKDLQASRTNGLVKSVSTNRRIMYPAALAFFAGRRIDANGKARIPGAMVRIRKLFPGQDVYLGDDKDCPQFVGTWIDHCA